MADRVRTHTRTNRDGTTTRVGQHSRAGRPKKALVSPGHSWKLFKKAMAHGKKKRRGLALMFGAAAALELGAWGTLSGVSFLAGTTAILAGTVAAVAGASAGWRL